MLLQGCVCSRSSVGVVGRSLDVPVDEFWDVQFLDQPLSWQRHWSSSPTESVCHLFAYDAGEDSTRDIAVLL